MKKYAFVMLVTAAAAVACTKEDVGGEKGTAPKPAEYVEMSFTAITENGGGTTAESGTAGTKTAIDGSTGAVSWSAGDLISVFDNSATATEHNNQFSLSGESVFSGTVPEDATEFYALYPYSADASFDQNEKTITATISAEQTAAEGTVSDGVALMAGKISGKGIEFKNLCSHICFTIDEEITDVKSITLMGNASEALCGTFSLVWNGEEPKVTLTEPETYVTLRNADGGALAPGTYWFTILPATFSKGFTVTLSKTDGSQKAKSFSSAVETVGVRNRIQPVSTVAPSQYADALNYFIKYNDGFDITVGGYTFNKTTKSGGVLVNDTKGNGNISTDGVYFIDPSATGANFNKAQAYKSLIVTGADSEQRSAFEFYRQTRPYDGGEILLMSNLECTVGSKNAFAQSTKETGNSFSTFGDIILSDCHFKNVGKNFMQFNQSQFTKVSVNVEDCEFGINATQVYIFNASNLESEARSIIFKNNIFYAERGTTMTDFKLLNVQNGKIAALSIQENTFDNTTLKATGLAYCASIEESTNVTNNYLVNSQTDGSLIYLIQPAKVGGTYTISNNYFYSSSSKNITVDKTVFTGSVQQPRKMDANPLNENWNPAGGVFGAYTVVTYNTGAGNVPETVGAKRAD